MDVAASLAAKGAKQPPLYYAVAHGWSQVLGTTLEALRALSATLSVRLIGAFGILAHALFRTRQVTLVAMALMAVSPIFVRYAQESRAYTLWLVFAVTACIFYLRAARDGRRWDWCGMALALAAAFWTHLLTIPLILGFARHLLLAQRGRAHLRGFLAATVTSLLLFSP